MNKKIEELIHTVCAKSKGEEAILNYIKGLLELYKGSKNKKHKKDYYSSCVTQLGTAISVRLYHSKENPEIIDRAEEFFYWLLENTKEQKNGLQ